MSNSEDLIRASFEEWIMANKMGLGPEIYILFRSILKDAEGGSDDCYRIMKILLAGQASKNEDFSYTDLSKRVDNFLAYRSHLKTGMSLSGFCPGMLDCKEPENLVIDLWFELKTAWQARQGGEALKPEGQRTKAEEWEACYGQLFNQLNPVMEENKKLREALKKIADHPQNWLQCRDIVEEALNIKT